MIQKYINHVHTKPLHKRKQIAYGISAGFTLIIGALWLTSFSYFNNQGQVIAQNSPSTNPKSPFSVIRSNLGNAYSALIDTVDGKESVSNSSENQSTATLEYVPQ